MLPAIRNESIRLARMASTPATRTALEPLRALRYDPEFVELGEVVAPPYDVISPADRDRYAAASSHSAVHLLLPDSPSQAARLLHEWRREGILLRDDAAVDLVARPDYVGARRRARASRSGFLSAVRLSDYSEGRVRPHEQHRTRRPRPAGSS